MGLRDVPDSRQAQLYGFTWKLANDEFGILRTGDSFVYSDVCYYYIYSYSTVTIFSWRF